MQTILTAPLGRLVRPRPLVLLWTAVLAAALAAALLDGRFGWLGGAASAPIGQASLVLLLLALVCEFVDATLGMGYGTMLVPLLMLLGYPVHVIVPAAVVSQLGGSVSAAIFHHRAGNVDFLRDRRVRNTALLLGLAGLLVPALTVAWAIRLPEGLLKPLMAGTVAMLGVFILISPRLKTPFRWRNVAVLGGLAAFNKALSGGGYGPLVVGGQVLAGLNVRAAVASTALAEAIVCASTAGTYALAGMSPDWAVLGPLLAGTVLSTPLSALTLRRLPVPLARKAMGLAITALGVLALMKVAAEMPNTPLFW